MKKTKKNIVTLALVLSAVAITTLVVIPKVSAAYRTYDISYLSADGSVTVNGKKTNEHSEPYQLEQLCSVEKVTVSDTGETLVTVDDTCVIQKDANQYLTLPSSSNQSNSSTALSYMLTYRNPDGRRLEAYEMVQSVGNMTRGSGLLFPIYQDPNSKVVLSASVFKFRNVGIQATFAYVGSYRYQLGNTDILGLGGNNFGITAGDDNSIFDEISAVKLRVEYTYSEEVISEITCIISAYDLEGKKHSTDYTTVIKADTLIDKLNAGITQCGGTAITELKQDCAVAGFLSGSAEYNNTITEFTISMSKSEDEYEAEIAKEAMEALPGLYSGFINNKNFAQANAYLEVYNQLTDELKKEYAGQMEEIISYLKKELVDEETFRLPKRELEQYPALLEMVWPSEAVSATENTRTNDTIYSSVDVRTATVVFQKDKLHSDEKMYLFSDLADQSDTGSSINDNFGITFWDTNVTFYTVEDASERATLTLPVIAASNSNLNTNRDNVVFKSENVYGKDQWSTDLKNQTASAPLSYEAYQLVQALPYMAVKFDYKVTEYADTGCSRVDFTVQQWADDGDGEYEPESEVLLIDVDRYDKSSYLAIAYLNGNARARQFALSKKAFDAASGILLEHVPSMKPRILGVTLGTSSDDVKLTLGFDFLRLLSAIAESGEQATQYGAVLTVGTVSYADMVANAELLLNEYEEDDEAVFDQGYVCTKKLPDSELGMASEYYVTISNSDEENVGKRATAIGYVIVEGANGEKTIHFTSERICYSAMGLLKELFAEEYLTNEAYVEQGEIVPNSLLAQGLEKYNAAHGEHATLDTIEIALAEEITSAKQRDLLLSLHYALNQY